MKTNTGVDLAVNIMSTDQKPDHCNMVTAWISENLLHSEDYDYPSGCWSMGSINRNLW